ncbi:MAG: exodeoxyribonuclease VII large subunit [Candidatus Omnitrophica bacterium]|nr:exodeoxyribonuclease VII large subunit [Candidatus Omnitrophota bacterium]
MSKKELDLFFLTNINQPPEHHIYTVSQLTASIKEILEAGFSNIWVEGEISNFNTSSAGHWYFSLKDKVGGQEAVIACAIFNRAVSKIKFKLENGLKVICYGSLNVYPPHGKYSLVVESIQPKGIGSLQLALEQLKKKLEKEGLFAVERKRPIPYLPSCIGVVTSPTGAAIRDILKVLERRFRDIHIILAPARVQGEGAAEQIAQAIEECNRFNELVPANKRIEVLIVGRGGGSIEDLWAFNEEIVARAIYHSKIPVISAVGHERDVTIADLVADMRAATPSVAAELVIPPKEDLKGKIADLRERMHRQFQDLVVLGWDNLQDVYRRLRLATVHIWELDARRLDSAVRKLQLLNPAVVIPGHIDKIMNIARRMAVRLAHILEIKQARLVASIQQLEGLNPLNILSRGYSVTFFAKDMSILKEARLVKKGDILRTRLYKGQITSTVTEVHDGRD